MLDLRALAQIVPHTASRLSFQIGSRDCGRHTIPRIGFTSQIVLVSSSRVAVNGSVDVHAANRTDAAQNEVECHGRYVWLERADYDHVQSERIFEFNLLKDQVGLPIARRGPNDIRRNALVRQITKLFKLSPIH